MRGINIKEWKIRFLKFLKIKSNNNLTFKRANNKKLINIDL